MTESAGVKWLRITQQPRAYRSDAQLDNSECILRDVEFASHATGARGSEAETGIVLRISHNENRVDVVVPARIKTTLHEHRAYSSPLVCRKHCERRKS